MEEDKDKDELRRSKLLIDGFNEACKDIAANYMRIGDGYMSAISFQTTLNGDLPHLSYILRNMDPLKIYCKTVDCCVTRVLIFN